MQLFHHDDDHAASRVDVEPKLIAPHAKARAASFGTAPSRAARTKTVPVTGGHCKLQWKPDFGMRWAALGIDYEMYGKEHFPSAQLYNAICRIAVGVAGVFFFG